MYRIYCFQIVKFFRINGKVLIVDFMENDLK